MNPSKDSCGNLHWNRIINTRRIRLYENSLFILTVPLESEEYVISLYSDLNIIANTLRLPRKNPVTEQK